MLMVIKEIPSNQVLSDVKRKDHNGGQYDAIIDKRPILFLTQPYLD